MGYLKIDGKLLTYSEYKDKITEYKLLGLKEFIKLYKAHKDKTKKREDLKWGEEMEYNLFVFEHWENKVKLANHGYSLIEDFNNYHQDKELHLQPEFGNWMVEAVPSEPYNSTEVLSELLSSFQKLEKRRQILTHFFMHCGIALTSIASPPMLGTPQHILISDPDLSLEVQEYEGKLEERNHASQSQFVIDSTENPHPRFPGLMKSIRERRGEKVKILVPLYQDKHTSLETASKEEPYPGQIYMDSMHFGMGCSCLQVTFETQTLNHARYLHDMLLPFTPLLAALSASAPIYKGKLSDIDLRWTVISQSVDCRNSEERDSSSDHYIPKSRYSSINHYISNHQYVKNEHFDGTQYKVDPGHIEILKEEGEIDERLAFHVASLFVRDPIPAYSSEFEVAQDAKSLAHFENLQSTNWNSLRFKPPPSMDSSIGWRVEFRTLDIQLTDYENAALIVVLGMIVNCINTFDVDFIMPISLIDENMDRAHLRQASCKQKFWIKRTICPNKEQYKESLLEKTDYLQSCKVTFEAVEECSPSEEAEYVELYLYEILGGKPDIEYKGIYPLIEEYMELKSYDKEEVCKVREYMDFLLLRAKGKIPTGATLIRDFVLAHPDYQQDSIVTPKIAYDLTSAIINLSNSPEAIHEMIKLQ